MKTLTLSILIFATSLSANAREPDKYDYLRAADILIQYMAAFDVCNENMRLMANKSLMDAGKTIGNCAVLLRNVAGADNHLVHPSLTSEEHQKLNESISAIMLADCQDDKTKPIEEQSTICLPPYKW